MNAEFQAALRRRFDALGSPRVDGPSSGAPTPRAPAASSVDGAEAHKNLASYGSASGDPFATSEVAVEEWSLYYHEGYPYYYNNYTGESIWAESAGSSAAASEGTQQDDKRAQMTKAKSAQRQRAVTQGYSSSDTGTDSGSSSGQEDGDDSDSKSSGDDEENSAANQLLKAKFQEYLRSTLASEDLISAAQRSHVRAAASLEASEIRTSRRRRREKKRPVSLMQALLGAVSSVAASVGRRVSASIAAARRAAGSAAEEAGSVDLAEGGMLGAGALISGAERVRSVEEQVRAEERSHSGDAVSAGAWTRLVPTFLVSLQERCLPYSLLQAEVAVGSTGHVLVMLGETTLELANYVLERTGEGVIAVAAGVWSGVERRLRELVAVPAGEGRSGEAPATDATEGGAVDQLEAQPESGEEQQEEDSKA